MDASVSDGSHTPKDMSKPMAAKQSFFKRQLSGTSNAFVAEYSVFLLALSITLTSLVWLIFILFILTLNAMHAGQGGASMFALQYTALWLMASSAVSLPATAILWSRTQGELVTNPELKNGISGGAKGFRTFWIVMTLLAAIGFKIAAVYAPLLAASLGASVVDALVGVTLPALLSVAVLYASLYTVTRPAASARSKIRWIMWAITALTIVLFIADYLWAHNLPTSDPAQSPYYTTPSYNDPYYNLPTTDY